MTPTQTYIVVGEDGGSSPLTGKPEDSIGGAEARLKSQGRRGYIAMLEGPREAGKLTLVKAVNEPTVSFDDVQARFLERNRTRGASNLLFRRV